MNHLFYFKCVCHLTTNYMKLVIRLIHVTHDFKYHWGWSLKEETFCREISCFPLEVMQFIIDMYLYVPAHVIMKKCLIQGCKKIIMFWSKRSWFSIIILIKIDKDFVDQDYQQKNLRRSENHLDYQRSCLVWFAKWKGVCDL